MPLPVEPAGVHPVASSPLARIAAAAQRARGGASPRPDFGVSDSGAAVEAEQAVSAEVTAREAGVSGSSAASEAGSKAAASVSTTRASSRVPTPADLMRSGVRPLPAAAASTQGVRLYASSVSEDADPALGLDEDLRLKLLSALQGMGTAQEDHREESREESAKAEAPKPTAPKPAAPKPAPPKPVVSKQAQPAEAGESATASAPATPAPKPLRPTPALFGKVQVAVPAVPAAPAAEQPAENSAGEKPLETSELTATPAAESLAPADIAVPTEASAPAEFVAPENTPTDELAEDESACGARIHPQQVREMHENFAERSRPIVLIGPMAAGKTYIGTHLARFYGYEFLDADQLIVERYGEVSEIFEIFGEAYFRELERKTIEEVLTSPVYRNTVFSLGGGAPMTDSVAELLKDECVVYILVDADTVTPRITGNKTRPLLQPNPVERWTEIFERRRSRYEELAHFTLDARGGRPITEMTAEIQAYVTATRASRAQRPQA